MKAAVLEQRAMPLSVGEVPDPAALMEDEVLLEVRACGVCHGDVSIADGDWDWVPLPRIIGHEIVGTVRAVGSAVEGVELGQRAGVGWLHGSCRGCHECRTGRDMLCEGGRVVTGTDVDGGYATYTKATADFIVPIPDELSDPEAAPLLCAGVSVFNGLRMAQLQPGQRVAVIGIGGLGHLAIQYANAAGAYVVAISGSPMKEDDARRFGAKEFYTVEGDAVGEALADIGGVDLAAVTGTTIASSVLAGLRPEGAMLVLGFGDVFNVAPADLCMRNLRIIGSLTGTPTDMAAALRFAADTGIRPEIELFSLDEANEALDRVRSGKIRYRGVLRP